MHATFSSYTGIPPQSNAYIAMMQAKMEREQKKLQMLRMEARLRKLQTDEEKTTKRLNDAKKQQEFVLNMKQEKQRQLEQKQAWQSYMRQLEESNRQKFTTERNNTKRAIQTNINERVAFKRAVGDEIKEQKIRIAQSIEKSKLQAIEEKRARFNSHREHQMQAASFRNTMKGEFFGSTSQQYHSKIEQTKVDASDIEQKVREMELRETQMIMRLQNTQKLQLLEQQKLNSLRSPAKSPKNNEYNCQHYKENNHESFKPLVLCGPSGAGKSTFTAHIMSEASAFKELFAFSVSSTTRQPRQGEVDGVHYHFNTREQFQAEVAKGNFLEHNEVHGNFYGTHKAAVRDILRQGKVCILDIDVKGAMDIAKAVTKEFACNFVFVQTPTVEDLRQRLVARGTETEETLAKRVSAAEKEMTMARECGLFQKFLINDEKKRFLEEATNYVTKELYPQLIQKVARH